MRYIQIAVLGLCVFAVGCGGSDKAEAPKEYAPMPGKGATQDANTKGGANAPVVQP